MDAGEDRSMKHLVRDVYKDFLGRREGLIKAMTTDFDKFYKECDAEKENLCLYGYPDGSWQVKLPVDEVPPDIPEPVLGINFSKEAMRDIDWLSLVAMHSDAWLISTAMYLAANLGFGKNDRMRLFEKINGLPNVYEVVFSEQVSRDPSNVKEVVTAKQPEQLTANQSNEKTKISGKLVEISSNVIKSKPNGKMAQTQSSGMQPKRVKMSSPPKADVDSDEEELDEDASKCGACGEADDAEEFWICCDVCEIWYHAECVKITRAKAKKIEHYMCPDCSNRKARVY